MYYHPHRKTCQQIRDSRSTNLLREAFETRMGKGKGAPEFKRKVIKPGKILFELEGVPENIAVESLTQAAAKLPIRCQVVSNNS